MGNSVGFYAVSRELGTGRVINPTLSDLDILTDQGERSSNVQRLSVTRIEPDVSPSPRPSEAGESEDGGIPKANSSCGSSVSIQSCSEVSQKDRGDESKGTCAEHNITLIPDNFKLLNNEIWKDVDSDTSSQPYVDTVQDVNEVEGNKDGKKDVPEITVTEACGELTLLPANKSKTLDNKNKNKKSEFYIPVQSTRVIESLLLELQQGDDFSIPTPLSKGSNIVQDIPDDRPIVYTATNAADWKLGTILEESGSHKRKSMSLEEEKRKLDATLERCSISEDEDGLVIGSVVNVNDIDAERKKEEGIQMCLEPYEEKIEKIEEYLLNSSDSHTSNRSDSKTDSARQSTIDVSAVIGANNDLSYLHFGTGLEEDISKVVAAEYSREALNSDSSSILSSSKDDTVVSEIHVYIDNYSPTPSNMTLTRDKEDRGTTCPHCHKSFKNGKGSKKEKVEVFEGDIERAKEVSGNEKKELDDEDDAESFQEAVEITEVTESWQQLYRGPTPDAAIGNDSEVTEKPDHSESSSNQLAEEMSQLRLENEKLSARNRSLQREVEELRRVKESMVEEDLHLKPQINQMTMELTHAKEALSALKADRKRLKAEKFDLLNQMKQLYATLEDKEKELRDFIRNYEQRMKESDESLRHLAAERDETEREKWNILKHARDESEKVVKLSAQLGMKEAAIKKLQEELDMDGSMSVPNSQSQKLDVRENVILGITKNSLQSPEVRKQLASVGYYSDAESVRTNGLPTPTASTPTCSPQPVSTPTPTPNGRGSSADSGVRLSSDRDSTASHDGGVGTPKESPSLSPLYATPSYIRGDDKGGDHTPTGGPTPTGASLNSSAMSGLASSNASSGGLSRSAEQLCERLAEAADASKGRGVHTLSRKSNKSGGTWGSISRVFARQKKRAALDASLYDGNGSDKRASWSPSSSLCVSPLTEESYSEKLRLLEEAQHIPLERWKAPTVLAWLEVTLGMPQYGAMCAENVRSGKVLLELNDHELEAGLGISHPMHRKKLRLAIEELREPRLSRFPRISALGHTWVSSEWLPDLGLPHYCDAFANNLVDGRLLEALTKKELEKHLGVHRKFHQASIIHGVHLLRIVRFDRQILAERRRQCENVDCDPIVWTNMRWVRWARSIDLAEYADNLKDSGVHGALVVLESSFTADTMATALGIPQSKNIIRRHLATELESLVNPARQQLDEQARYAKLERRRQEKLAAGGSLGRSFSRSYGTGLEKTEKDKRRASLRGSLSRALGLRVREDINAAGNGGESSSSGGQSPAVSSRAHPHHPPQARPRSSVMPSGVYVHHETHRRVKSIGDIETITVTPV